MKSEDWVILAGVGILAFLLFQRSAAAAVVPPGDGPPATGGGPSGTGIINCKFPDGTMVPVGRDGTCPYDIAHGGQSGPCYVGNEPGIESICFLW